MILKRQLAKVIRFGITKRLRRGGKVTIFPSYTCNYTCTYCSLRIGGVIPKSKPLSLDAWKQFLINYDEATIDNNGLREVILTGGEPTLLPYFVELCEWILFTKRWHLTIFSNLSNLKLLEVKPSIRLRIGATLHHHVDPIAFDVLYRKINKIHRVDVEEIDYGVLPYSVVKPFLKEGEIKNLVACIRVAPDQTIHLTCRGACEKFI